MFRACSSMSYMGVWPLNYIFHFNALCLWGKPKSSQNNSPSILQTSRVETDSIILLFEANEVSRYEVVRAPAKSPAALVQVRDALQPHVTTLPSPTSQSDLRIRSCKPPSSRKLVEHVSKTNKRSRQKNYPRNKNMN